MPEIKTVELSNGQMGFRKKIDPTATTSTTSGNVTVNNMGRPGLPSFFDLDFMITAYFQEGEIEFSNIFNWSVAVLSGDTNASYREVESQAARQIAPMMRAAADRIEALVAEYDQKNPTQND